MVPLLLFECWLGENWTSAHRNAYAYEKGKSEVGSKVEGIRFIKEGDQITSLL